MDETDNNRAIPSQHLVCILDTGPLIESSFDAVLKAGAIEHWGLLYLHYWREFLFWSPGRATDQRWLTAPDTNVRGTNSLKIITAVDLLDQSRSGGTNWISGWVHRENRDMDPAESRERMKQYRRCYPMFNQFLWMLVNVRIPGLCWPVLAITHIYLGPEPHSPHLLSILMQTQGGKQKT